MSDDYGDSDTVSVFINDGDGGFASERELDTGSSPRDVAIGDVNGDGRRDLVVADAGQPAVSVLLNTMGGGEAFVAPPSLFPHAKSYASGRGTVSVAVGDLNGDGRQDIVTTSRLQPARNKPEGAVNVLLGSKSGFAEEQRYEVGLVPRWVAIGDLDKDGAPDLAVTNTRDDTVSILVNKGDGTFKKKRDYPTGHKPYTVAIGDLDGDGSLDLAIGDAGPIKGLTVSVLLNDGKGSFGDRRAYRTARAPLSVAIADVNRDGRADLVTANHLRRSVSVLLNAGKGTLAGRRDYRVGRFPRTVAIGDLNGDGALDLAVADTRDDGVSVLLNPGDGSFGEKHDIATGSSPSSIVIGDYDGDHVADLATNDVDGWTVCVLDGKGDGSFGEPSEFPFRVSPDSLRKATSTATAWPVRHKLSAFAGDDDVFHVVVESPRGSSGSWVSYEPTLPRHVHIPSADARPDVSMRLWLCPLDRRARWDPVDAADLVGRRDVSRCRHPVPRMGARTSGAESARGVRSYSQRPDRRSPRSCAARGSPGV